METKHYVLLVGIVISLLLSLIATSLRVDFTPIKAGNDALWMIIGLFIFSWILGGIIFWGIKKLYLDEN